MSDQTRGAFAEVDDCGNIHVKILTEAPLGSAVPVEGVTDHGALTGLSDPDHPISAVIGLQAALDGKAATGHTHTTGQVTGLDTALAGKAPLSHTHPLGDLPDTLATDAEVTAAVAAHANAVDPHGQYLQSTDIVAGGNIVTDSTTLPGALIITAITPPSGGSVQGQWTWLSTTQTGPNQNAQRCGVNNDNPRLATVLYMNRISANSIDRSVEIGRLVPEDEIQLQQIDLAASWHRYLVTGVPVLTGDVWSIPVTTVAGSQQGTEPSANTRLLVTFMYAPASPARTTYVGPLDPVPDPKVYTEWLVSPLVGDYMMQLVSDGTAWFPVTPPLKEHTAAADPHPQYLTKPEADALYAAAGAGAGVLEAPLSVPPTAASGVWRITE